MSDNEYDYNDSFIDNENDEYIDKPIHIRQLVHKYLPPRGMLRNYFPPVNNKYYNEFDTTDEINSPNKTLIYDTEYANNIVEPDQNNDSDEDDEDSEDDFKIKRLNKEERKQMRDKYRNKYVDQAKVKIQDLQNYKKEWNQRKKDIKRKREVDIEQLANELEQDMNEIENNKWITKNLSTIQHVRNIINNRIPIDERDQNDSDSDRDGIYEVIKHVNLFDDPTRTEKQTQNVIKQLDNPPHLTMMNYEYESPQHLRLFQDKSRVKWSGQTHPDKIPKYVVKFVEQAYQSAKSPSWLEFQERKGGRAVSPLPISFDNPDKNLRKVMNQVQNEVREKMKEVKKIRKQNESELFTFDNPLPQPKLKKRIKPILLSPNYKPSQLLIDAGDFEPTIEMFKSSKVINGITGKSHETIEILDNNNHEVIEILDNDEDNVIKTIIYNKIPKEMENNLIIYGENKILSAIIFRQPISKGAMLFASTLSLGEADKIMEKNGYNYLFHAYMLLILDNGIKILFEKNERVVLTTKLYNINNSDNTTINIPGISLEVFINNALNGMGKQTFLHYNPRTNNCQIFLMLCLKFNKLLTPELEEFLVQKGKYPKASAVIFQSITDIVAIGHNIIEFLV